MHYSSPNNMAQSLDDISGPRLSNYRTFFNTSSDSELYGTYCWNDAISTRLMQFFGIIEITLRNRFHLALSQYMWNSANSFGSYESNDWYKYTSLTGESLKNVQKVIFIKNTTTPKVPTVSPNTVVSKMTFGFWPRLLDVANDHAGNVIPWESLILSIVPSHHQRASSYWLSQHSKDKLFARMTLVADLRNRVAHFEPVWKLKELKSEWRQRAAAIAPPVIIDEPVPATPQDAINRLVELYRRSRQLLYWLSQSRSADYMDSECHYALNWLLSMEALKYYTNTDRKTVRLSCLAKPWGLKEVLRENSAVTVTDKARVMGRFYPLNMP